jgi:hypothetical protein
MSQHSIDAATNGKYKAGRADVPFFRRCVSATGTGCVSANFASAFNVSVNFANAAVERRNR